MPLVRRTAPAAAQTEPPASFETLLADLRAGDARTRRSAARQLAEHAEAAPALCDAAVTETEDSVRETIFTALIRIGGTDAAEGLIPLLQSEDVALRNAAIEALKTMPDAVALRIDTMLNESRDVRIFAVEILGALVHPESPRRLIEIIATDDEVNVCAAAVNALVECGDDTALAPLRALGERFPDEPFLEFSIRIAIARIANA